MKSLQLSKELSQSIQKMADENAMTWSAMARVLLTQAVRKGRITLDNK